MTDHKPVIMVIEDETLLLRAITKKLLLSGYEVVSCVRGDQALDYLKNLPALPDLIWLDYYLKDIDGVTFMEHVNKNPDWSKIPVIVVSNSASAEKVKHMLKLGAKKYLLKASYRLDEIISIIKTYIKT